MFSVRMKVIFLTLFITNINYELASAGITEFTTGTIPPHLLNSGNEGLKISDVPTAAIHNDLCLKPECIHTASRVLKYMDSNVAPCDNFYKFACGHFIKTTEIPYGEDTFGNGNLIENEIKMRMRSLLKQKPTPSEPKHVKIVKNYYQNCMSETAFDKSSFLSTLSQIGGWPLLEGDSWKNEDFQWEDFASKVKDVTGLVVGFFPITRTIDRENSSKFVLSINSPRLSVNSKYKIFLEDIAVIFGAEKTKVENELKQIIEIETKISSLAKTSFREKYSYMTVKDLEENYSNIQWKKYFNVYLNPSSKVEDNDIVEVQGKSYFEALNSFIGSIPKREQANYLVWDLIFTMANYLNDDVEKAQSKRYSKIDRRSSMPKWQKCYEFVEFELSYGLSVAYIQNYFNKESKSTLVEIIHNIMQQFEINIQNADWLDHKTKMLALDKLAAIQISAAYDDEFFNAKKVDEFYENLEINSGEFYQSFINLTKFTSLGNNIRILSNRKDSMYQDTFLRSLTSYNPVSNAIDIEAGQLEGDSFNNDRPQYMNYGALGSVIGHAITSSFGDKGRNYDKEGNPLDWWQPEAKEQFLSKTQCFIDQYENFGAEEVGLNVNGRATLEQNIADNGGVKTAYLAYKKWEERHGSELLLPGLDYTQSQLFWISFAQSLCVKFTPEKLRNIVQYYWYTPPEFQILGSLSNIPEFAGDFKCAQGTKMNPEKKCSLW